VVLYYLFVPCQVVLNQIAHYYEKSRSQIGSQVWGRTTFNRLTVGPLNRVRSWDY